MATGPRKKFDVSLVDTIHQRDRRTDRQRPRLRMASRGENNDSDLHENFARDVSLDKRSQCQILDVI